MKRATALSLYGAAGAVLLGLSGLSAQQSDSGDVSGYPPEVQKQHRLFVAKCSRCHDLTRPLTAKYTTEAQWRDMVARMARKPGASISPRDQKEITTFLVFHQKARSGQKPAAASGVAPAATGETVPAAVPAPPAATIPTPETLIPAPPAARAEGTAAGGGLRVEVEALPAQPIMAPVEGRWTTEAPGAGENLFLAVRLFDEATGEKVPYATVRARVGGNAAKPLRPLFGGKGFQYGGNFAAPAGDLEVALEVEPPALARVNDDGRRWTSPLHLKLTLRGR